MSPPNIASASLRFNVADILATETDSGEVRANIGFTETGKGIGAGEPMWFGSDGFIGRPNDPDDDGACMAWFFADGNDRRIMSYRDNRFSDKVGEIDAGDRAIISRGEARFLLKAEADSVTLYTVNQNSDESMICSLSGEDGVVTIANGGAIITMTEDSILLAINGGAFLSIGKDGVTVGGNQFTALTLKGQLGAPSAGVVLPPTQGIQYGPPPGVTSSSWTVLP